MVSSLQFPSPSLLPNKLQCNYPLIGPWIPSPSSRIKPTKKLLPLASSSRRSPLTSWTAKQESSTDGFGGWFSLEPEIEDTRGIPKIVLAGVGASMAILIGVFGYYSFSKGGVTTYKMKKSYQK